MKKTHRGPASARAAFWLLCILMAPALLAAEEPIRLETLLIWGTNDPQAPDPKHIPVEAALAKKLGSSPYRWTNYFQINRQVVEIPLNATKEKIEISKRCTLDIKNLGECHVDVKLYGEGKSVFINRKESVAKDSILTYAGDSGNDTAWLVVIRRTDSPVTKNDSPPPKAEVPASKPATNAPAPVPPTNALAPLTSAPPPLTSAPPPLTSAPPPLTSAPPPLTSAPPPLTNAPPPLTNAPPPK